MSSKDAKINLTLAFVLNNAAVDDQGKSMQNPDPAAVQANIVNRVKQSTYAKDFDLVWGPSLYLDPGTKGASKGYSANVTAVFKGPSGDLRLVTSGTNPTSDYDVKEEDNDIGQTAASGLISGAPSDASISKGANAGAQHIISTTPGTGGSLVSYLQGQVGSGGTVVIVGHSLGGALASVLTLYLQEQLPSAKLNCYTFAAPTAGNQQFANYFDKKMAGASTRFFNTMDTVPDAWNATTIQNILTIYNPNLETPQKVQDGINNNLLLLDFLNYQQPGDGKTGLTGAVNTQIIKKKDTDFDDQVAYQHIQAYMKLLDMQIGDVWLPPPSP